MKRLTNFSDISQRLSAGKIFWIPAVFFVAVAFALFANTFPFAWTYDDIPVILQNQDLESWSAFLNDKYPGRPLRELSLMLDRSIFGMEPAGWRIQHLFWHGLNGFLVFALVARLGGGLAVALIAGLVFLVHPVQVEVVANLSHRKVNLCLAFMLLSLHAWISVYTSRRKLLWGLAALFAAVLASLAYQVAYLLPLLWIVYEYLFVAKDARCLGRWPILQIVALLGAVGYGMVWFFSSSTVERLLAKAGYALFKFNHVDAIDLSQYLQILLKSWAFMFWRVIWPFDLAVEYVFTLPAGWNDIWVLAALAGLLAWLLAVVYCWRRSPLACFALLWIALFWLPVSNLYPTAYFAADRYMYVPLAGCAILFAAALCAVAGRYRKSLIVGAALTIGLLAFLTMRQNLVWQNDYSLFQQAYRVSPLSPAAQNLYGIQLIKAGQLREGLNLMVLAARNPFYFDANMNAAMVFEQLGEKEKALYYYKRAGDPHGGRQFNSK